MLEYTLATDTFTNINFVMMGLKKKVLPQHLQKNAPVMNSALYFHNITESEAVGGKENDRKFKLLFCTNLHKKHLLLGPTDTQLCISLKANVAIKTVLNPSPMH